MPKAYLDELHRLLGVVTGERWQSWWSASPVKLAEVFYWFDATRPGVRVRVGKKVTATIERPVASMEGHDPVELARADVMALTDRLTARLELPEPPALT